MNSLDGILAGRVRTPGPVTARFDCQEDRGGIAAPSVGQTISTIIADTHPLLSGVIQQRLSEQSDIYIVANLSSLDDVAQLASRPGPKVDIVILHVARVNDATEKTIQDIAREAPANSTPYVLVVSGSESAGELLTCLRSGARGYLSNTAEFGALSLATRLVARGGAGFDALTAQRLPGLIWKNPAPVRDPTDVSPMDGLTEREREVAKWLAMGCNNRSIARELFISERTVRNHLTRIFLKFGVQDRLQAALVARRAQR